jgi:hypothetical protein
VDDSSVEHQSPSVEEDDSKGHKVEKNNGDADFDKDGDGNAADG